MHDVEVFSRDGRTVKHRGGATHDDKLDSRVSQSPKKLSDVSFPWTWHLSRPEVKQRSVRQREADPKARAKAPNE